MAFFSISNLLQWIGFTSSLDPYESIALPTMWAYFIHTNLSRIDMTDLAQFKDQLHALNDQFSTLLRYLPKKMYLKDNRSVYITCNFAYAQEHNLTPNQITGKTDYDFFPSALADKYRKDDARIIESGKQARTEEQYLTNGVVVKVTMIKIPVLFKNNTPAGILGILWSTDDQTKNDDNKY